MRRFVCAIALACALSGTALAGDVHSTDSPAPGDIHTTGEPAPGEIPSVGSSIVLVMLDLVFQVLVKQ